MKTQINQIVFVLAISVPVFVEASQMKCINVEATQINLGPDGIGLEKVAKDSGLSTYKIDREKLVSEYIGTINFEGDLVKEGFGINQNVSEYFEFQDRNTSLGRNKITTIHRSKIDNRYRVVVTHTGNNDGSLYQRSYWYLCD